MKVTQSTLDREQRIMRKGQHCHTHYGASGLCHGGPASFINHTGAKLLFQSMVTGEVVGFDGFITEFTDMYEPKFETQEVYGRMDPIAIYKNTTRRINIAWTVVGVNYGELTHNWHNVQKYIQMLYPAYKRHSDEFTGSLALSNPPLMKLKFMNLAMDSAKNSVKYRRQRGYGKDLIGRVNFENTDVKEGGLLVVPGSITVNTNLGDTGAILSGGKSNKAAIPREISLSSDFVVLHQHELGHSKIDKEKVRREIQLESTYGTMDSKGNYIGPGAKLSKKLKAKEKKILSGGAIPTKDFTNFPYGVKKK